MKETKIGEYVRTKNGIIAKLIDVDPPMYELSNEKVIGFLEDITKRSKNIVDLIKPGEIIETDYGEGWFCTKIDEKSFLFDDGEEILEIQNEQLKSILTDEQYTNNCYKRGED